jgi:molybdopterin synthase sulfur carrier subunit
MKVSFYATLRKIVGEKTVDIRLPDDPRLQDLLDEVLATYPALREDLLDDAGELSRHVHLFVNGRSSKYLSDGLATPIDTSQKIEFFPAVAGG